MSDDDFDTGEGNEEQAKSDYSGRDTDSESSDTGIDEDLPEFDTTVDQNAIMLQLVASRTLTVSRALPLRLTQRALRR